MAGPFEARGGRGTLRRGGRLLGDEGALPHVGPRPPARDEVLVGLGHGGPVHAQVAREVARGGQLDSRGEQALADQTLQMQLDLAREGETALAVASAV